MKLIMVAAIGLMAGMFNGFVVGNVIHTPWLALSASLLSALAIAVLITAIYIAYDRLEELRIKINDLQKRFAA